MKRFIISNDQVYIEDDSGNSVSFDKDKYFFYTGEVNPTEHQVVYEPDRELYAVFDGTDTVELIIPNADYEALIADVESLSMKVNDPYYGLAELAEIADRLVDIRFQISAQTETLLRDYYHVANDTHYNLTDAVRSQLLDIKSETEVSLLPDDIFPVTLTLGVDGETGVETSVSISTLIIFNSIYTLILEHLRTIRNDARVLKESINSLTLSELVAWVDPRS